MVDSAPVYREAVGSEPGTREPHHPLAPYFQIAVTPPKPHSSILLKASVPWRRSTLSTVLPSPSPTQAQHLVPERLLAAPSSCLVSKCLGV